MSNRYIVTSSLSRHYQRGPQTIKALDDVSLEIDQGEFFGVVGSSGSGKSTLLNLLAGLDTPTSGQIDIGGKHLGSLTPRELAKYRADRIGMVFQSFNLIPHFTALENVALSLIFKDISRKERFELARESMEHLGLGDRLDHRPADMSGGEQQRVAVARALVKKPEILLADEPTGNLDQDNSTQIVSLLRDLNNDGLTIVMVTHDLRLADEYTHRKIRMNYGRILTNDQGGTA